MVNQCMKYIVQQIWWPQARPAQLQALPASRKSWLRG